MMDVADGELLARFQQGDAGAFGMLYERYKSGLYGYALSLCHEASQAQDVVQELWLKFIERAGSIGAEVNLRPYLFTALRNLVIDQARRKKSEQRALEGQARQRPLLLEPVDPVAGAEEAARVNAALAELPEDQRETLLLKMYGPFTFEELAEVVKAPAKTVMSRYRLALEKLGKALESESE